MKQRVLFICTHNSAQSQMAEGLYRHVRDQIRIQIENEQLSNTD